jgi:ubiquitin-conjugating enzyme E2 Z
MASAFFGPDSGEADEDEVGFGIDDEEKDLAAEIAQGIMVVDADKDAVAAEDGSSSSSGSLTASLSKKKASMAEKLLLSGAIGVNAIHWDPFKSGDWTKQEANFTCLNRIKRDLMTIFQEPPPGMFVIPDADDMTLIHALITGPFDTPYEGGFFYFVIRCPPNYPIQAPRVKLMTTGSNTVRFNPNLYKNGKVCLSILGTWAGPAWSPALSLSSLLISIQSLLNEKPYHNEPGYDTAERQTGDSTKYNRIIQHETIRVAVIEALERPEIFARCQPHLEMIKKTFPQSYEYYETVLKDNQHLDGQPMNDPFGEKRGKYDYTSLLTRLQSLREAHQAVFQQEEANGGGGAMEQNG